MKKILQQFFFILTLPVIGWVNPVLAGTGSTHPMAGALWAKYLAINKQQTKSEKVFSCGSAILVGVTSHLVSDHLGNFEPHNKWPEMVYFSFEGAIGFVLLYPQWKRDQRLLCGSLGGMLPDIEHTIRFFSKNIFPTHSGAIPHGERESFWQGAIENLIFNSFSYYLIAKNFKTSNPTRPAAVGFRLNVNGLGHTPLPTPSVTTPELLLRVQLNDVLFIETSASTWIKRLTVDVKKDFPARLVIQSYLANLIIHLSNGKFFSPFIGFGGSLFVAHESKPVNYGSISFTRFLESQMGFTSSAGIDLRFSNWMTVVLNMRFQSIRFNNSIATEGNVTGWQPSIGILHHL